MDNVALPLMNNLSDNKARLRAVVNPGADAWLHSTALLTFGAAPDVAKLVVCVAVQLMKTAMKKRRAASPCAILSQRSLIVTCALSPLHVGFRAWDRQKKTSQYHYLSASSLECKADNWWIIFTRSWNMRDAKKWENRYCCVNPGWHSTLSLSAGWNDAQPEYTKNLFEPSNPSEPSHQSFNKDKRLLHRFH